MREQRHGGEDRRESPDEQGGALFPSGADYGEKARFKAELTDDGRRLPGVANLSDKRQNRRGHPVPSSLPPVGPKNLGLGASKASQNGFCLRADRNEPRM